MRAKTSNGVYPWTRSNSATKRTEANLKEPKAECKPLRAASAPLVEIVARNPKPGLEEELVFTPEYFQVIPNTESILEDDALENEIRWRSNKVQAEEEGGRGIVKRWLLQQMKIASLNGSCKHAEMPQL